MDCPICGEYGKTYASKPLGAVKIRYRKCDGCKYKYRTFEEIDANPVVRGHEKTPRYPLADPANIICPNCTSATLRHDRKTTQVDFAAMRTRFEAKVWGDYEVPVKDARGPVPKDTFALGGDWELMGSGLRYNT